MFFFINARELGQAQEVLADLENLEWGRMFNERLDAVVWPPKVKRVSDVCLKQGKAPCTCLTIPSLLKGGDRAYNRRIKPRSQKNIDTPAWGMGAKIVGRQTIVLASSAARYTETTPIPNAPAYNAASRALSSSCALDNSNLFSFPLPLTRQH